MARATICSEQAAAVMSSHRIRNSIVHIIIVFLSLGLPCVHSQIQDLSVSVKDMNILVEGNQLFKIIQIGQPPVPLQVTAQTQHSDIVQIVPTVVDIPGPGTPPAADGAPGTSGAPAPAAPMPITYDLYAYGKSPGHSEITFNVTPAGYIDMNTVFLRITVMHSNEINIISYIMGWIYFAAWSVSFYPQIYINFKRKSVVGLNFDFLALNIFGFTMYSLFNCGLYFSREIQSEYFSRHPRGLNPVQLNDVFFSLHAAFATLITIAQCFFYEREEQRVSLAGRVILSILSLVVLGSIGAAAGQVLHWLDFLYYCSYIKLCITLIKYLPQAYMNYKRKSTVGWSIGNIFLDLVGGSLSILQMVLNGYNYNDWASFFGDFTKFGLGLISLLFDVFFILQHYVFYREGKEFVMVESSEEGSSMTNSGDGKEYFLIVDTWHAEGKTKYDLEGKM